jgi:predicted MFS family arabinose efflux permease
MAIVLGVVCFFLLPSSPSNARFLTKEEQVVCVWRIAQNQTGIKNEKFLKYQAYEALCDFRVWCLFVQLFCIGLVNGSLTNYFSAFLKGFGWSSMDALKYQLPIGGLQVVATIFAGYLASRFRNRTIIIILVLVTFGVAALVGWSTIPAKHKMALTACTWLVAPYGASIILVWAVLAANFAGHTKRTTINGINFTAFWAGNFVGPFVFNPSEAPRYPTATRILGGMIGLGWVATAAMGLYMWNANKRRDAKAAAGNYAYDTSEGELGGFTDRTDKENKSFRYRL